MPLPGASKLSNFTVFYARNPYKFLHTSSSSAAVSATADSRKLPRLKYFAGWRWRKCFPAGRFEFTSRLFHIRRDLPFGTSDYLGTGKDCRYHRRADNKFRTEMGATGHGKADTQYKESDLSPSPECDQKTQEKPPKFLTLPTILTIGRVAAVPLLVSSFYIESWWGPTATTGIFLLAAITDWLDGYLARKMKLLTEFGAFLDPVADKLMVAATLILLCTRPLEVGVFGQVPWLFTVPAIAIIGREITMSALREWAASQDKKLLEAVAVNNLGKWKTATQMSALTILLAARDPSLVGSGTLVQSGVVLLYISAWLSIWSLAVYMRKIWKVLML